MEDGTAPGRAFLLINVMVSCLPLRLGGEQSERYDPVVAVMIATITFVESLSGRRRRGLIIGRRWIGS